MTSFKMELPEGMLGKLSETSWWDALLTYRDNGQHLFIAVRDGYLSAYLLGRAVFKEIRQRRGKIVASFDRRYVFGERARAGDLLFDGETVKEKDGSIVKDEYAQHAPPNFERFVKLVKKYRLVNPDDERLLDEKPDLTEKACLAPRALAPSVINLEMQLRGFRGNTKGTKGTGARIDMVHLEPEQAGAKLVFTEAKLFSNVTSLRVKTDEMPKVLTKQIFPYMNYLARQETEVTQAYRNACSLLARIRQQQGVDVHPLIEAVREGAPLTLSVLPRLLIFRTERHARMVDDAWLPHRHKIECAGIEIEEADCNVPVTTQTAH